MIDHFHFDNLQAGGLARILDSNPKRVFEYQAGIWSVEQSVILATRPSRINLKFAHGVKIEDDGKAFVEALEQRKSSFGSLCVECYTNEAPFSRDNFRRLLSLQVLDNLTIGSLENDTLAPLSVKANALSYKLHMQSIFSQKLSNHLRLLPKTSV